MKTEKQLQDELKSFQGLWPGGTNLAKLGWDKSVEISTYLDHEEVYKRCIKPYTKESVVLEIGAGGGGWTRKMLDAKEIICFDALSAKHNKFWERIPKKDNIKYYQVSDFSCKQLRDNSIDLIFSYDVFCHISYSGAVSYIQNLYPKLKSGANCFIMIADADKYTDKNARRKQIKVAGFNSWEEVVNDHDGSGNGSRWYFYGLDRFCNDLQKYGYEIIERDMNLDKLSPIIHFKK